VTAATKTDERITPADIEGKLRQLRGEVDTAAESAKSYLLVAGAVAAVALLGIAFWIGRRRGKKMSTIVEIRRV